MSSREGPLTWVTIAEASARTGVSKKAIRSKIERGTILNRKSQGGLRLVPLEAFARVDDVRAFRDLEPREDSDREPKVTGPVGGEVDPNGVASSEQVVLTFRSLEVRGTPDAVAATVATYGLDLSGWIGPRPSQGSL